MKYLQRRNHFIEFKKIDLTENQKVNLFKKSEMISETFENDIPWGDSLLGRLINSTIRKGKIMINAARISRLPPLVENALDELLANVVFTPEQKKQVIEVKIRMLLEAIIKVVKGDDKIADKLAALLGKDKIKGLIDVTYDNVEKVEDFEAKDELLKKLKDFKEALLAKRNELEASQPSNDSGEEEVDDEPDNTPPPNQPGAANQPGVIEEIKKILKSTLDLFKFFKTQPQQPQPMATKKWNGKEVIVISDDNEKVGPGGDKKWNTNDDEFGKPPKKIPPGNIQIIIKNPLTNKFDKDSEVRIVHPDEVKESIIFEAVDSPIQKQVEAAKKKIGIVYGKIKFDNKEKVINKFIELLESNNEEAVEQAKELMKEVVKYESTTGGAMKFQDLIKLNEAAENFATSEYKQLVEPIGSIAKVLLGFKDNMDFLENLKDAKEPIKAFIQNYLKFREETIESKEGGKSEPNEENKAQSKSEGPSKSEDNKF
jgi:hypothetical protein